MNDTPPSRIDTLDAAIQVATSRLRPDVLPLSGGLDSAPLAAILFPGAGRKMRALVQPLRKTRLLERGWELWHLL